MRYAIEANKVNFSYSDTPVVEDVTFKLPENEYLAVLGPNGGGKTTLVKLFLGILKPVSGDIRILGEAPGSSKVSVGYVPQDMGAKKEFPISVFDAVMLGTIKHLKRGSRLTSTKRRIIREKLELLGMWDYRKERVGELSGGQRQRVFIARALAAEPDILYLDEPTSGVDSPGQSQFHDILKNLNKKMTIVVITHDISVVSKNVTSVACINRKLHFHGAAELTDEMLELAYGKTIDGVCPVELIAHGIPHRVLPRHGNGEKDD